MDGETDFNSFTGYKQMVMDLTGDLKKLKEYSAKLELSGSVESINDVLKRLAEDTFSVAVIGEFKRGKSTLINALLGKDVLPMDVLPTTATLNRITYSITPFVKIEYKEGRTEEIAIENLNNYVTKLTSDSEKIAKTIKEATVYYPINYCKNNVDIIDTPGLNDDEAMAEVTLSVLPKIDAALMVIMAQAPFAESERAFLENKLITSDLGRIIFVVTGIDLLDEEDVERVLNNISTRIEEHVMTKAAKTMGADTKEFEVYKRKIGKVRVFGLSAKMALKAKLSGDQSKLEKSGFPAFEKALERFLTEDRGAVMLGVPVSRIKTVSIEIFKTVELRENALKMKKEEFDEKYNLAIQEIESIREQRHIEFNRINTSAQYTFDQLKPMIKSFWPEIENAAIKVIDNYSLESIDIDKKHIEDTRAALAEKIKKEASNTAQNRTESIQNVITTALENEAERLSDFENSFYETTEKIQNLFSSSASEKKTHSGEDTAIGSALNYFTLVGGGAYLGFKQAGWKGALLGGVSGGAGMFGSAFGAGLLIGLIGLPFTWPVALVVGIGSAIVGTFTSQFAVGKIFSGQQISKFKDSYREAVLAKFAEMKAQDAFSDKVRTQVESAFELLKSKIQKETENILNDTQNSLTKLKVDLTQNTIITENQQEELQQMLLEVNKMVERAEKVNKQLSLVLNR